MVNPGPARAAALIGRGLTARDARRLDEAEAAFRAATAADPGSAEAWHHLGLVLQWMGRLDDAEAAWRRVLEISPEAHGTARGLAVMLLSLGRFEEGFAVFEARHVLPNMAKPRLPFAEWKGEPLAGRRLLVWPEQGYGDQIQFARFLPILQGQGAQVTVICRPGLERLFEQSMPGVQVLSAAGQVSFPDPDYWVMAGSLAWRMGITVETIPGQPYLRAAGRPPRPLPEGFKVGLTTAGNPAHQNDANRSLPPPAAARLRALDAAVIELDPAQSGAADFADTAAIIDELDLVISVDTAVAHLAGALGKPCWTLVPLVMTDWRWLRGREDSPWYPSMRLYRQQRPGDWTSELDRIAADLARLRASTGG